MNVLRRLPIRGQMYMIALLTMAVFVAILLFNYNRSASFIAKNNEVYTNDIFGQMEQTILSNYDVVKWLTYNIAYNKSIQDYLLDEDMLSKVQRYPTVKNLFLNLSTVKPGISDFVVVGKNGDWFSLQGSSASEFGDFMPKKADSYFSKVQECKSPVGASSYCFAVGTNIFSSDLKRQYTNVIGRIILIIDASTLTGGYDLKSLQPGTGLYLLDRTGRIFMSNDRGMIGKPFEVPPMTGNSGVVRLNGELTHIQVDELPQIGGRIVRVIPDDVFFRDIRKLQRQSLLALAAGILLLAVPFLLILNNMIFPMRKLYQYLRISDSGDLNKRINLRGSAEAAVIGNRYNQMLSSVQHLTRQLVESNERLYRTEIEKKQAEFDFLKSQVNPHFLYNTLDAIRGIAAEREVPEIRDMTRSLSRIFRYSIKGHDIVPLGEELRIVEAFMNIQTIRFSHRFRFDCAVPDALRAIPVPKMILQPIVENAVYHGLEPQYEPGALTLTASVEGGASGAFGVSGSAAGAGGEGGILVLTVRDDGVGMDEARLAAVRERLADGGRAAEPDGIRGIGLSNVHHRLQFLYGSDYGLAIGGRPRAGTEVTLRIPIRKEGGDSHV
ncbi:two-component system, sensor histidine kinase YesM [Paenibacillus sp. UNC496MF]|uniref:sensor histidine kinase n=1 Tax=Paenibacillus sp. UNC496MF TaxID=1502753 RepID=UPI0008F31A54|nr:histidine kinase [Paenibacillus sp. UNC496MF]SFI72627.1 two-component system, sensor histidine kinase YesM [Paenibacillus sp. UNC496MF]